MDYVFVLEEDPIYLREITDALKNIQENFEIRSFASLAEFSHMLKSIMTHGNLALAKDDREPLRLVLVVMRLESLGLERLSLLQKTQDFFLRRGLCPAEEPTRFVLTAFDDPQFNVDELKHKIVSNVIMKPFDKLILEQHLQMAMPQVKSSHQVLMNQKTSALVEMLKAVDVQSMTELGFTSRSEQKFEIGSVSKYYGKDFITAKHLSVMARLESCRPVAEQASGFDLNFRFVALDPTQISNIRRIVRAKDNFPTIEIEPQFTEKVADALVRRQTFVIIDSNEGDMSSLQGTLKRKIASSEVVHFKTKQDFEADLSSGQGASPFSAANPELEVDRTGFVKNCVPADATFWKEALQGGSLSRFLSKEDTQVFGLWLMGKKSDLILKASWNGQVAGVKFTRVGEKVTMGELQGEDKKKFQQTLRKIKGRVGAVFVEEKQATGESLQTWKAIHKLLVEDQGFAPPCYVLSHREMSDDEEKTLAENFSDVFFYPLDRIYLLQKLIFDVQGIMILEDPVVVHEKRQAKVIRAASPITIDEISEALVVFNYHRPLEIFSFRDFILWQPNELEAPQLSGVVNACLAGDEKTPSRIFMTFFGVRDDQLKAVRLWIRNNYIAQKEKGA